MLTVGGENSIINMHGYHISVFTRHITCNAFVSIIIVSLLFFVYYCLWQIYYIMSQTVQ